MRTWMIPTLCGMALWGLFGFTSKFALNQGMDYLTFTLINCSMFMFTAVAALWMLGAGAARRSRSKEVSLAVASGVVMGLGQAGFFGALDRGPVSAVVPLSALYPIVTIVLSLVFLKERLSVRQSLGIGLALLGGVGLGS